MSAIVCKSHPSPLQVRLTIHLSSHSLASLLSLTGCQVDTTNHIVIWYVN